MNVHRKLRTLIRKPLDIAWAGALCFVFVFSIIPQVGISEAEGGFGLDKLGRFCVFAFLSLYPAAFFRSFKVALLVATSVAPFGFFLEVLQKSILGRNFSPEDMVANNLGSILGIVLAVALRFVFHTGGSDVRTLRSKIQDKRKQDAGKGVMPIVPFGGTFLEGLRGIGKAVAVWPQKGTRRLSRHLRRFYRALLVVAGCLVLVMMLWFFRPFSGYELHEPPQRQGEKHTEMIRKNQEGGLVRDVKRTVVASDQKQKRPDDLAEQELENKVQDQPEASASNETTKGKRAHNASQLLPEPEDGKPVQEGQARQTVNQNTNRPEQNGSKEGPEKPSDQRPLHSSGQGQKQSPEQTNKETSFFSVQTGAFRNRGYARELAQKLEDLGYKVHIFRWVDEQGPKGYKVSIGEYRLKTEAETAKARYEQKTGRQGFVILFRE